MNRDSPLKLQVIDVSRMKNAYFNFFAGLESGFIALDASVPPGQSRQCGFGSVGCSVASVWNLAVCAASNGYRSGG
jgi:hypothetical protein